MPYRPHHFDSGMPSFSLICRCCERLNIILFEIRHNRRLDSSVDDGSFASQLTGRFAVPKNSQVARAFLLSRLSQISRMRMWTYMRLGQVVYSVVCVKALDSLHYYDFKYALVCCREVLELQFWLRGWWSLAYYAFDWPAVCFMFRCKVHRWRQHAFYFNSWSSLTFQLHCVN